MLTFFVILSIILLILLCVSVYFVFKLGVTIVELEDQIEESLDILDECYTNVAEIANKEVMSDEPFIRHVVANIQSARDAILLVANMIASLGFNEVSNKEWHVLKQKTEKTGFSRNLNDYQD